MPPFAGYFREELKQIDRRRELVAEESRHSRPEPRDDLDKAGDEPALRKAAFSRNLVGLALSGGGIRSATFNLGFVQGLANARLLPLVDYLSTVSGGGYIGSWLAAWILRDGSLRNVQRQLHPNRRVHAEAERPQHPERGAAYVADEEPEAIRHLRSYSNYLAPRLGLFSSDSWVLAATYIRNLLLNLLVLAISITVVLLGLRLLANAFIAFVPSGGQGSVRSIPSLGWVAVVALLLFAASVLVVLQGRHGGAARGPVRRAVFGLGLALSAFPAGFILSTRVLGWPLLSEEQLGPGALGALYIGAFVLFLLVLVRIDGALAYVSRGNARSPDLTRYQAELKQLNRGMLLPLLIFSVTISWMALWGAEVWDKIGIDLVRFDLTSAALITLPFLVVELGIIWHLLTQGAGDEKRGSANENARFAEWKEFLNKEWKKFRKRAKRASIWGSAAVVVALLWGVALYAILLFLHDWGRAGGAYDAVPLQGPFPVVVVGPPVILLLFVGCCFLLVGLIGDRYPAEFREWWSSLSGWILMFVMLWSVTLAVSLYGPPLLQAQGFEWIKWIAGSTWLAAAAGGVLAGKNTTTDGGRNRLLDWLVLIAPHIFLLGLFILLSFLVHLVLSQFGPHPPAETSAAARYWLGLEMVPPETTLAAGVAAVVAAGYLGWRININTFSLHEMYANRLVRCFLGASRGKAGAEGGAAVRSDGPPRAPDTITGFDPDDDIPLSKFVNSPDHWQGYHGPFPVITTALNLLEGDELAWQERKADAFALTPLSCGSRSTGYRPTRAYAEDVSLGTAIAISGAAVSPNMGYHSSPAVTALLTVFNVRLGAWLGNPSHPSDAWKTSGPRFSPFQILREMFGRTNARSKYLYLSDGGHFDNLGVYELIRRRCRFIIACDAGADPQFTLHDLGSLIRRVRTDFGVRIDIDTRPLRPEGPERRSQWHVAVGKIRYDDVDGGGEPSGPDRSVRLQSGEGVLIYVRPTLTGDEASDVVNYVTAHPQFPHERTADQFFSESQFESYRALGHHTAARVFEFLGSHLDEADRADLPRCRRSEYLFEEVCELDEQRRRRKEWQRLNEILFGKVYDHWFPPPPQFDEKFQELSDSYAAIQDKLRSDPQLHRLARELYVDGFEAATGESAQREVKETTAERLVAAEMLTVLENAFYGLRLDQYHEYRVYDGWMQVFRRWFGSPSFQQHWTVLRGEFSDPFRTFVEATVLPSEQAPGR